MAKCLGTVRREDRTGRVVRYRDQGEPWFGFERVRELGLSNFIEQQLHRVLLLGFVGLLPGIGGAATLALMIPFVFKMSPAEAFAFLLGMHSVAATTGDHALLVSPLDIEGTALAMRQALEMSTEERYARLAALRENVHSWNAAAWLTATELGLSVLPLSATAPGGRWAWASQARRVRDLREDADAVAERDQRLAGCWLSFGRHRHRLRDGRGPAPARPRRRER